MAWQPFGGSTGTGAAAPGPTSSRRRRTRGLITAAVLAVLVIAALVVALRSQRSGGQTTSDDTGSASTRAAVDWITAQTDPTAPILADDVMVVRLLLAGRAGTTVFGYDEPVRPPEPAYIVTSSRLTTDGPKARSAAESVVKRSVPVAVFGTGADRVEVRQVLQTDSSDAARRRDATALKDAGTALARNPGVQVSSSAKSALTDGDVDGRLISILAALARDHKIEIKDLPVVPGEKGTAALRRSAVLASVDGKPASDKQADLRALATSLRAQSPPFRPSAVDLRSGTGLVIGFSAPSPSGLVQAGPLTVITPTP